MSLLQTNFVMLLMPRRLLLKINDVYCVTVSQVFLKYYHVDLLCQLFEAKQRCIIRAQSVVRMRLQRKHYLQYKDRLYSSVVCIQKGVYICIVHRHVYIHTDVYSCMCLYIYL